MIKETIDIDLINKYLSKFDSSIKELGVFSKYIIYYDNDKDIAFLNYSVIYDRAEIEYIFVDESFRKQNIGSKLFDYMINSFEDISNITLEVRESNKVAISFYESKGFKVASKREKYYGNEDGLLMIKEVL